MKAEVIYVRSMYLGEPGDGVEISEVCEVLLFECSLPDQEAIVIPYKNSETIILKKGDIRTCFHDAKMHLISFDLSKPLEIGLPNGHSFTTLTLKLEQDGNPMHIHKSEFYLFLDFALKNFLSVDLKQMRNSEEFHRVITTQDNLDKKLFKSPNFHDIKFKFHLRCYVYFLNQKLLSERNYKKFLRKQKNLPEFLRDLKVEDLSTIFIVVKLFLFSHICCNTSCAKLTHKKCSACRVDAYCSIDCQTKCWIEHEMNCKIMVNERKLQEESQEIILGHLKKQFAKDLDPVSMNVFIGELEMAFIVLISPIIEDIQSVDDWFVEILSLIKKNYIQMRKKLNLKKVINQMFFAWNEDLSISTDDFDFVVSEFLNPGLD